MTTVHPSWFLALAATLFCIGLYGALARRSAVAVLMGIFLMLDAVILNLVAFGRALEAAGMGGQVLAVLLILVAAAETALGLALVATLWQRYSTTSLDDLNSLKE